MKKVWALLGAIGIVATTSFATPIDITVGDEDGNSGFYGGQEYDMEAFLWDGSNLSIISGFNMKEGRDYYGTHYDIGDVYLDEGNDGTWDYVIDLFDGGNDAYAIYDYDPTLQLDLQTSQDEANHSWAKPFAQDNSTLTPMFGTPDNFTYSPDLSDADLGYAYAGGTHYMIEDIDLSSVAGNSFTVHLTMGCGNDYMEGKVPEPAIIAMLGLGLLSIGLLRKKR
jgi:hypothetical protein